MNTGLPGYCNKGIPVPRVLCQSYRSHRSSGYGYGSVTELTEVPGKYKNAVPVPRVFVARAYRAYRSYGYGYECTELTEVCRVIPGVNTPGMVLYVPYRTQPWKFLRLITRI